MISSVAVLLTGMVIIAAIGSVFGYLLEPGRFEKRDAAQPAATPQAQTEAQGTGSPRLAA